MTDGNVNVQRAAPHQGCGLLDPRTGAGRVRLLALGLAAMAVALQAAGSTFAPLDRPRSVPWLVLVAMFAAAEIFVIHVQFRREHHSFSLCEIPLVVGLFCVAPGWLVVARLVGSGLALKLHRRPPTLKLLLNLGWFATEVTIAYVVFRVALGGSALDSPVAWAAAVAGTLTSGILGVAVIALAIALYEGRPEGSAFRRLAASSILGSFTNTILALVAVTLLMTTAQAAWLVLALTVVLLFVYRAYAELLRKHESLELLYDFTRHVGGSLDVEEVMHNLLAQTRTVLKAELAEITFVDPGTGVPGIRTQLGGDDQLAITEVPPAELADPTWQAVIDGQGAVLVRRGRTGAEAGDLAARGIDDALIAPLRGDSGVTGVLLVGNRLGGVLTFDDSDLKLFEALANHASMAIQNGRLVDRLRQEAAAKEHQALHDSLTGLPNRRLFQERVDGAVAQRDADHTKLAILLIDLDRFKEVNDTLGHHNGDALLQEVAQRLRQAVPDQYLVARLGGDEFAVLLPQIGGTDEARSVADYLVSQLERPFTVENLNLEVGASIGVATYPDHGHDPATLLQRADVAMYAAKASRAGAEVYSPHRDQYSPERLALVGELRQAIEAGNLGVHFQPQADLATGEVHSVEALVRWVHPTRGYVSPEEFVAIAEHTGLIRPLTRLVIDRAVTQYAAWRRLGLDLGIAVNLSVRDLLDVDLPDYVHRVLLENDMPTSKLTLEITETVVMSDPGRIIGLLHRLRAMGVRLAVDDFGTGYSSLSYLKQLPVAEIKVDRSFVTHLMNEQSDVAIVQSVVDLGRNLGRRVVAEGVEDEGTWERLRAMGCDDAQGYWLSRPLPAHELECWLLERRALRGDGELAFATVVPLQRRA